MVADVLNCLVADAHPLVRDALAHTIASLEKDVQVLEAADLAAARRVLREREVRLAVVSLDMPEVRGVASVKALREDFPAVLFVIVSARADPGTIEGVLTCGVAGFIPKTEPCALVLQALRLVLAGGVYVPREALPGRQPPGPGGRVPGAARLTGRQRSVLVRLLRGHSNKLIARDLELTEGTIKTHVAAILRELGASTRTEAVVRAHALGLDNEEAGIGR